MSQSKIHSHSHFNSNIKRLASLAKHPFARDCEEMLNYFFEIESQIPSTYHWTFTPTEALFQKLIQINDHTEWNNIYWRDICENIQAYSVLTYQRGLGIIRPVIRSLNTGDFLASAILARSALELSAWFIYHARFFRNTALSIPAELSTETTRFTNNELQTKLVKLLWGTRLETVHEELKQINILTIIKKVSEADNANFLKPTYDYLCEATHPNIVGNAEFWEYPSDAHNSKSFTIKIRSMGCATKQTNFLHMHLGALGWSSACYRNGMIEVRKAIEIIGEKLLLRS
ncbi:MAG: hypothetical protein IPP22_01420 [Nitrosomonas sp.]|nr:hypothetical protein [Nitrosomonas sp.]